MLLETSLCLCHCSDDDEEWEDTEEGESDSEGDVDSEGAVSGDEDGEGHPREFMFMDEETKTRFTEYSMTSSVMRRNEQLTLLDDRFEKVSEPWTSFWGLDLGCIL